MWNGPVIPQQHIRRKSADYTSDALTVSMSEFADKNANRPQTKQGEYTQVHLPYYSTVEGEKSL